MKCFYHRDTDAVGICRHCSRALCPACAAERESGLACINRCEGEVDRVGALVKRNVKIMGGNWAILLRLAVYFAGTVVLAWLGFVSEEPRVQIMLALLAALMLVLAISGARALFIQSRR